MLLWYYLARLYVNEPANVLYPETLAKAVVGEESGFSRSF